MKEEEEQILATGVKILNQIRRIVWDGEERFVLISKLPVWKNGVLKGIVGYVMDLTSGDALDTSVYTLLTGPQRQNRQQVVELGQLGDRLQGKWTGLCLFIRTGDAEGRICFEVWRRSLPADEKGYPVFPQAYSAGKGRNCSAVWSQVCHTSSL